MTTKPPLGLAASGHTDNSDTDLEDLSAEIDVDSSQDVTVEASEESTLEVASEVASEESTLEVADEVTIDATETPPPLSALIPSDPMSSTPPPRRAPTLLGLPIPSLPLPGVTAVSRPSDWDSGYGEDDDVTLMKRPSVTDDDEEATKVEPAATAVHAAASRDEDDDEVTTALSAQASVEREKALRKSIPPSLDLPLPYRGGQADLANLGDLDDEFEDPEDDDVELAHDTPAVLTVDDEAIATSTYLADQDEPSSELEAVLAPRRPAGSPPFGSAIGSYARSGEGGFGATRLPTPSPGYGVSLPSPGQGPAPSNSPFSARMAPAGAPYAGRTSAPMPAIQIPAPSGAAALPSSKSWLYYTVHVPVVGLIALVLAAGGTGVLFAAKLWRSGGRSAAPTAPVATSAPAPVIQQVPAPAPLAPPAAASPVAAGATPPIAAGATAVPAPAAAPATAPTTAPTVTPIGEQAALPAAKPIKHAAVRPLVRKTPVAGAPATATAPPPAGPVKPRPKAKVAKGWVDPFAE